MNLTVYIALDDDTLAALTSKGLLRRARKDLERAPPQLTGHSAEAVVLTFPDENVTVTLPPTGPQQAICTCPAEGICRHILSAVLFVPQLAATQMDGTSDNDEEAAPAEEASSPAPPVSPLDVTETDLSAWAGRALYRQALDDIADDLEVAITESEQAIIVEFMNLNTTTRWILGAGLPGMICSCKRPAPCRHRVAAVLLYQAHHGQPLPAIEARMLTASAGAPRSRAEVLASVAATLVDLVHPGLTRLSRTTHDRLQTLAISAHGVDLPRLERMLRSLADQVDWYLSRDVRASASTLLSTAARTYALAHALQHAATPPPAELVGEHRARYFPVSTLNLAGLGAQQWRTRSGYAGVSLFFWDTNVGRWATWSESRPTFYEQVAFNPQQRYQQAGPWNESPALTQLCRSHIRLGNARRNRAGRLSASAETRLLVMGTSDPAALDLTPVRFADWQALAQHLTAVAPAGLREYNQLEQLVVITPEQWGEPHYDQARQALIRPLLDAAGRALLLVQPHHATWPFAVDTVQQWQPQQWGTWGILGSGRVTSDGLELLPIALLNRQPLPLAGNTYILNVTLDAGQSKTSAPEAEEAVLPSAALPADGEADDDPANSNELTGSEESLAVGRLLAGALTLLEHLAEQGTGGSRPGTGEQLAEQCERLRQVGLGTCANSLVSLAEHMAVSRHQIAPDRRHPAYALLAAIYVLRLAQEQIAATRVQRKTEEAAW